MRQKFKARELWLFVPFLLIIAAALYWARVEKVAPKHPPGLYIAAVKIEPASSNYQGKGLSHRLTVTISSGDPKPKWWGTQGSIESIDALQPKKNYPLPKGTSPSQVTMFGETMTVVSQGKRRRLPTKFGCNYVDFRFDGTNYVSVNYLGLAEIPQNLGEVTLHGLYRVAGQPQIVLKRVVRRKGQKMTVVSDKTTGAKILKAESTAFGNQSCKPGAGCRKNRAQIKVTFRRTAALVPPKDKQFALIDSIEIVDAKNNVYQPNWTNGFGVQVLQYTLALDSSGTPVSSEASVADARVTLYSNSQYYSTFRGMEPLRLRGTLSVDKRWPIPFEIKLPPRPTATAPAK